LNIEVPVSASHRFLVSGQPPTINMNTRISVRLHLEFPKANDVAVFLFHEDGYWAYLTQYKGGPVENIFNGTLWVDDAPSSVLSYDFSSGVPATLKPENSFQRFQNFRTNAYWTIGVRKSSVASVNDTVLLRSWELNFERDYSLPFYLFLFLY